MLWSVSCSSGFEVIQFSCYLVIVIVWVFWYLVGIIHFSYSGELLLILAQRTTKHYSTVYVKRLTGGTFNSLKIMLYMYELIQGSQMPWLWTEQLQVFSLRIITKLFQLKMEVVPEILNDTFKNEKLKINRFFLFIKSNFPVHRLCLHELSYYCNFSICKINFTHI
jgi:hypothetical protein